MGGLSPPGAAVDTVFSAFASPTTESTDHILTDDTGVEDDEYIDDPYGDGLYASYYDETTDDTGDPGTNPDDDPTSDPEENTGGEEDDNADDGNFFKSIGQQYHTRIGVSRFELAGNGSRVLVNVPIRSTSRQIIQAYGGLAFETIPEGIVATGGTVIVYYVISAGD